MNLSAPKQVTFIVAVVIAILGLLGALVPTLPFLPAYAFWLVVLGFIVLVAGNMMEGM